MATVWANEELRTKLLESAQSTAEEKRDSRDRALCTLQSLSAEGGQTKREIWDEERARTAILEGAKLTDKAQIYALSALWNLSAEQANKEGIWEKACKTDAGSSPVADAARLSEPHQVTARECALAVCWNVAASADKEGADPKAVQKAMWEDETLRSAVVEAAEISTEEHCSNHQTYALSVLENLAAAEGNRKAMWDHDGTKDVLIKAADLPVAGKEANLQARDAGMNALCNLALFKDQAHHVSMWNNESARRCILKNALNAGANDAKAKQLAWTALSNLAVEAAVRPLMWADAGAKEAILMTVKDPQDKANHEVAIGILQHLSMEQSIKGEMWSDKDTQEALAAIAKLDAERNTELKQARWRGFGALWNLASHPANKASMWQDGGEARDEIVKKAKPGAGPEDLQERALAILWNLATEDSNRQPMWEDQGCKDSLVDAALNGAGLKAKAYAVAALHNIADKQDVRSDMWAHPGARQVFAQASMQSDDTEMRERALKTLCFFASMKGDALEMWKDPDTVKALGQAADLPAEPGNRKARVCALRALQFLSYEGTAKQEMINSVEVCKALGNASRNEDKQDMKARHFAVGTLKNLTTEQSNKGKMWKNDEVQSALITAAGPIEGDDQELALKIRASALGALQNLSMEEDNKKTMWEQRSVLVEAAQLLEGEDGSAPPKVPDLRERALATLWNLTTADVPGDEIVENVLQNAATKLTSPDSQRSRDYAMAALQVLQASKSKSPPASTPAPPIQYVEEVAAGRPTTAITTEPQGLGPEGPGMPSPSCPAPAPLLEDAATAGEEN